MASDPDPTGLLLLFGCPDNDGLLGTSSVHRRCGLQSLYRRFPVHCRSPRGTWQKAAICPLLRSPLQATRLPEVLGATQAIREDSAYNPNLGSGRRSFVQVQKGKLERRRPPAIENVAVRPHRILLAATVPVPELQPLPFIPEGSQCVPVACGAWQMQYPQSPKRSRHSAQSKIVASARVVLLQPERIPDDNPAKYSCRWHGAIRLQIAGCSCLVRFSGLCFSLFVTFGRPPGMLATLFRLPCIPVSKAPKWSLCVRNRSITRCIVEARLCPIDSEDAR